MDTSILPQDQSFGQKSAGDSTLLNVSRMPIPRKRATILWDRTLEDVFEDDDGEMEEEPSMSREAVQDNAGNEVVIAKEKYMVCARATLRISIAWNLEAMYSGFLHLALLFFFCFPPHHLILPKCSVWNYRWDYLSLGAYCGKIMNGVKLSSKNCRFGFGFLFFWHPMVSIRKALPVFRQHKIVPLLFYTQESSGPCSLRNSNFSHFWGRQGVGKQRTRDHFMEVSLIPKKGHMGKKGQILWILSLSLKVTLGNSVINLVLCRNTHSVQT